MIALPSRVGSAGNYIRTALKIFLPLAGWAFGDAFDRCVALGEKSRKVGAQDQSFGEPAERAEWRLESQTIAHDRAATLG